MKIYLSSAYSRKREMRKVARKLKRFGIKITSQWLNHQVKGLLPATDKHRVQHAIEDWKDVKRCNIFVRFADMTIDEIYTMKNPSKLNPYLLTGARHTEMGMALALGIPTIVIGGKQNVFDWLPQVKHFQTKEELYAYLGGQQ